MPPLDAQVPTATNILPFLRAFLCARAVTGWPPHLPMILYKPLFFVEQPLHGKKNSLQAPQKAFP
jgi:hypothetical protein